MELFKKFISRKAAATAGGIAVLPALPEGLSWPVAIVLAAYVLSQAAVDVIAAKKE